MTRSLAQIAAHQAADSVAALLLFDHEGHFGDIKVVEKLAEALAPSIDLCLCEVEYGNDTYRNALQELEDAANRFIDGGIG